MTPTPTPLRSRSPQRSRVDRVRLPPGQLDAWWKCASDTPGGNNEDSFFLKHHPLPMELSSTGL